jgi:hypothetical protein
MHNKYIITYECYDNAPRMWKVVQLEKYFDFSLYSHHFSLLSLTFFFVSTWKRSHFSLWFQSSGSPVTIPVSTFTIDFIFKNCFLSVMTPYVDSCDGRSLSIYGSECQIWKTFTTMFTAIDPNKDISKTRQVHVK